MELLYEWELRDDHDLGPGFAFSSAWLKLYYDGSGQVIAELCTVVDQLDKHTNNLLTALGVKGRIEKKITFETLDEAEEILSKPLVLEWEK
jgi:hypothetical protein